MSTTGRVSVNHARLRQWIAENYGTSWRGAPTTSGIDHFRADLNSAGAGVPGFRMIKTKASVFFWLDTSRSPTTPKMSTRIAIDKISNQAVPKGDWLKIIKVIERYDLAGWQPPKEMRG
jgi:hypothetical protein